MQHNDKQRRGCVRYTKFGIGSGSCPCYGTVLVQLYRAEIHLLQLCRGPYGVLAPVKKLDFGVQMCVVRVASGECALICPLFRAIHAV